MKHERNYLVRAIHGRDNYGGGQSLWIVRAASVDNAERIVDAFLDGHGHAAPTGYETQVAAPSVRGLELEQIA